MKSFESHRLPSTQLRLPHASMSQGSVPCYLGGISSVTSRAGKALAFQLVQRQPTPVALAATLPGHSHGQWGPASPSPPSFPLSPNMRTGGARTGSNGQGLKGTGMDKPGLPLALLKPADE